MRFGNVPTGLMRQVVRENLRTYTLTRRTGTTAGTMGEVEETTTTVDTDLWLFSPSDRRIVTEFGDRDEADLEGVALSGADVQERDALTYGSENYEVTAIQHIAGEDDQTLKVLSLEQATN